MREVELLPTRDCEAGYGPGYSSFIVFKFIWNGGNDTVKGTCIRNIYDYCGLRMINPYNFSLQRKK